MLYADKREYRLEIFKACKLVSIAKNIISVESSIGA